MGNILINVSLLPVVGLPTKIVLKLLTNFKALELIGKKRFLQHMLTKEVGKGLISYRNQSIDLLCKSMDWFLYDIGLRHERVKVIF